jgi:predicted dehydrogenase
VGYGLIGCGGFGRFCLEQYGSMHSLERRAVADIDAARAEAAASKFGLDACSVDELLERPDIDLVHVATPPFTHVEIAERALAAGKHVLCEKPLATELGAAKRLVKLARERELILAVNLIMRYNPLCEAVKRIIEGGLLGAPLHGYFENYAKDEQLPPGHWFWDAQKSGGIFVEHGVHFFDLFAWWLGAGRLVAAQEFERPGSDFVDQVNCTAVYGDVPINFYHGFTQSSRMDRQELRLLFERGSITLDEWVPTRARIDALLNERTLKKLRALGAGPEPQELELYAGDDRKCRGRNQQIEVDGRYLVTLESGTDKLSLYGHVLRALMADQLAALNNPSHTRRIDENNGLTSLKMAAAATRLAGACAG